MASSVAGLPTVVVLPRRCQLTFLTGGNRSSLRHTGPLKSKRGEPLCNHEVLCQANSQNVSVSVPVSTEWSQKIIELDPYRRGCHIITDKIYRAVPEIKSFEVGMANLFVMHTSASLTINENASPDVPLDMEDALNRMVPEGHQYRHLDEGLDDMPAHVKSSMMGCSLTIPIRGGRFCLGIWQVEYFLKIYSVVHKSFSLCLTCRLHYKPYQGIWLNEHRDYGGPRKICITLQGKPRSDGRLYK